MNPFKLVEPWQYKDKNFFPCINDEYRQFIRDDFAKVSKKEIEALTALRPYNENDEDLVPFMYDEKEDDDDIKDPFDFERPAYERKDKQPRRSAELGSVFNLIQYFEGLGATSLVRCLKDGDDGDVSFQVVDPVTSLKGKYVTVVCAFVPNRWCGYNAELLCRLWVLSKEMASNDQFEILIVGMMRNNYEADLGAFKQFFSGFPNRLGVSFDNPDLRGELCYNLGFHGEVDGVVIDPIGKIVRDNLIFLEEYGGSAFPFTDDSLKAAAYEYESLTSLLRCDPSTRLYKFGFPSESITVEQLSKKLVGLYLFRSGDLLVNLHKVYHQCRLRDRAKGIEPQFDIVLFCLPASAKDPATFESEVHGLLKRMNHEIDASSWWVYPYDNSAGRRLSTVSMPFSYGLDVMVTVGPDGEFIDFFGGHLARNVGLEAYPFSMVALIQRFAQWADQTTLVSLFTTYVDKLVKQNGSRIDLEELQYKNVLLYVDSIPSSDGFTLDNLIKCYPKIKEQEPDVEVVFVSCTPSERGSVCQPKCESEIPWVVCPYHPELSASLQNHSAFYFWCDGGRIHKGLRPASVVAFVKGGGINVLNVVRYLYQGSDFNPFSPQSKDLCRDIYHLMHYDIDFMRSLPSCLY